MIIYELYIFVETVILKLTCVSYKFVHIYQYSFMVLDHIFNKYLWLWNDLHLCAHTAHLHIFVIIKFLTTSFPCFVLKLEVALVWGSWVFSLTFEYKSLLIFSSCSAGIVLRLSFYFIVCFKIWSILCYRISLIHFNNWINIIFNVMFLLSLIFSSSDFY